MPIVAPESSVVQVSLTETRSGYHLDNMIPTATRIPVPSEINV